MSKKNPLLSSAGLTFDDFTHNARLMPAAAPVPVATVVPDVQGSRGSSEEPKGKSKYLIRKEMQKEEEE